MFCVKVSIITSFRVNFVPHRQTFLEFSLQVKFNFATSLRENQRFTLNKNIIKDRTQIINTNQIKEPRI